MPDIASNKSAEFLTHATLEQRVCNYLVSKNYIVDEATYHNVMSEDTVKFLRYRFTPTALYIRTRADRIACHRSGLIDFEWEAKTHDLSNKYRDLTIEVLPLMHHINKIKLGVKCLYVFDVKGINGGFWVDHLPPIKFAAIPPRREYESMKQMFTDSITQFFPGVHISYNNVGGSGDPFVIFDYSVISKLPHWKTLIDSITQESP